MQKVYYALDLGGTKCAALLGRVGQGYEVLGKRVFDTRTLGKPEAALGGLCAALEELADEHRVLPEAIGVSCGNPMDAKRGVILAPPNMPGWDRVHVTDLLAKRFGVPARLMNDANAGCLAEARYGAARGYRHAVFLTMGTGMGAGMILNGQLYEGASGSGGEVGHMRLFDTGPVGYGKRGSFEGFCSGGGIAQLARQIALEAIQVARPAAWCPTPGAMEALTTKDVALAAQQGDALARRVFAEAGDWLGRGLSVIIDVVNPEIIAIGGIFPRCRELLAPAMSSVIERETLADARDACAILPASLGEEIGDVAALCVAEVAKNECEN